MAIRVSISIDDRDKIKARKSRSEFFRQAVEVFKDNFLIYFKVFIFIIIFSFFLTLTLFAIGSITNRFLIG